MSKFKLVSQALGEPAPRSEDEVFSIWKNNRNPYTTGKLLTHMQPAIDKAISAHVGASNPLLRSRARKMALQAASSWDPKMGAQLSTHIVNHLQGLKRVNRQQNQIIKVPERVSLEQSRLTDATRELADDLGRDPSDVELADYTGIPIARQKHIRTFKPVVAEGSLMSKVEGSSEPYSPGIQHDPSHSWAEMVYADVDPIDQKIMEYSMGLHGHKPLQNQEIAAKLRLTPGAISQRKQKIQLRLDEGETYSPFR